MKDSININKFEFRVKKMNAIEMLAMQSQISFENAQVAYDCYTQILEKLEVKFNDNWLPVKEKGKEVYYPANMENDLEMVRILIEFFLDWFKSVFQKSNESRGKTE